MADAEDTPRVDPWIVLAFEALLSNSGSYGLVPCLVGAEQSAAIVMGREADNGMEIMPLFVALTPGMKLRFPLRSEGGGGGGPRRDAVAQAFAAQGSESGLTRFQCEDCCAIV